MLLAPLYPHYRRHRSHHPLREMCGWIKRLAKRPFERRYAERLSRYLEAARPAYYLLPLQLETDYQIRRHSRFKSMAHVMEVVLESFARAAPRDSLLVDQAASARQRARELPQAGAQDRAPPESRRAGAGHGWRAPADADVEDAKGVVVVNSTTGLSALHHGRPVAVLGKAIFNLAGLTFKGPLDDFWKESTPPDPDPAQGLPQGRAHARTGERQLLHATQGSHLPSRGALGPARGRSARAARRPAARRSLRSASAGPASRAIPRPLADGYGSGALFVERASSAAAAAQSRRSSSEPAAGPRLNTRSRTPFSERSVSRAIGFGV